MPRSRACSAPTQYVNKIARNDLPDMTMMINEEQNGIAYPLRYLGKSSNPLMPFFAFLSPLSGNNVYRKYSVTPRQLAGLQQLRTLTHRAVAAAFQSYRAMGDQMLTYHGPEGHDVWQPVFTPAHVGNVRVASDTLGSSDQVPFTQAGVRSATFVGNATYYQRRPPAGSYPYDQPQDTIGLMNVFADGGSAPSHALKLALGLPGLLTTWLLSQPSILGQAAPDGRPVAAIGDTGVILPGRNAAFTAVASFVPAKPGAKPATLHYVVGLRRRASGRRAERATLLPAAWHLPAAPAGAGRVRQAARGQQAADRGAADQRSATSTGRHPNGAANPIAVAVAKGLPPHNPAVRLPGGGAGRTGPGGHGRAGAPRRSADHDPGQAARSPVRRLGDADLGTGPSRAPSSYSPLCW